MPFPNMQQMATLPDVQGWEDVLKRGLDVIGSSEVVGVGVGVGMTLDTHNSP